jgi:hypothetical protein
MISSADLVTVLLVGDSLELASREETHVEGHQWWTEPGDLLSADPDFRCPSAGRFVSVYREYLLSVLTESSDPEGRITAGGPAHNHGCASTTRAQTTTRKCRR